MLDEQHLQVIDAVRDFTAREVEALAGDVDLHDRFPEEMFAALGELGYLGSVLPQPHGQGDDLLALVLTVEQIAAHSPSLAWAVVVHVSAAKAIASAGTPALAARLLPALANGQRLASFAFTEAGSGADFFAISTRSRADGASYEVNGAKTFISLASRADVFVTLTLGERDGESVGHNMLAIERDLPGFSNGGDLRGMGMRGNAWGEIVFHGCQVPDGNLLGAEGKGTAVVYAMAGPYLLGAAALGLGIAAGAYEAIRGNLKERKVKGKLIGDNQGLQFRLSDLSAKVEAARSLVYRAATDDSKWSFLPFQAKLFASETAIDLTRAALQLGGANAYVEGSRIERLARDAYALTLHFENNDFLRGFMGRMLAKP